MQRVVIFIFYLILVIIIAGLSYSFSSIENKMTNSLIGAFVGVVLSYGLWHWYGQYMVTD